LELLERHADRSPDVGLVERIPGARVEEHDLVKTGILLHPVDHVDLLLVGPQLGREVLAVGADVVRRERHGDTSTARMPHRRERCIRRRTVWSRQGARRPLSTTAAEETAWKRARWAGRDCGSPRWA